MEKLRRILFYKPYNVLCQFTSESHVENLSQFGLPEGVYAAGRLDKDSEGLLLLTNDGSLIHQMTDPKFDKIKTYWVQVENEPTPQGLEKMRVGLKIQDYVTRPCKVKWISTPNLPERNPPIRKRKNIPTAWLEIKISEGKNRQVRHMTAAIGNPTLRLVRFAIGEWTLGDLKPGEWKEI